MIKTAGPGCPSCGAESERTESEHVMACSMCGRRWQSSWWWAHLGRQVSRAERGHETARGTMGGASATDNEGQRDTGPEPGPAIISKETHDTGHEVRMPGKGKKAKYAVEKEENTRLPSIGIKPAEKIEPETYHAWLRAAPEEDPKTWQARQTAAQHAEEWGIRRVMRQGTQPVMCMARAERRVRDWRNEGKGNDTRCKETGEYKRQPPVRLVEQLVHWTTLPTAVANDADRYYLPMEQRHLTTDEMCDAFGIAEDSTLRRALQTEATPTQATEILGAAIHVPTMKKVLLAGLGKAGVNIGRGAQIKLYDVCSGVSTVAEAMEQITGGNFEYVGAAEKEKVQRRVLEAAWAHRGLTRGRVYKWAYGEEAEEGPRGPNAATVYVMTPDCSKWSQNTNGAPTAQAMEETEKVATMMRYAHATRPAVVVLESVSDLLGPERVRGCGRRIEQHLQHALPDYEWYGQAIDAHEHGGAPMRRNRAFWMGVRPSKQKQIP